MAEADPPTMDAVAEQLEDLGFDPTMKKKKSSTRKKSVAFEDGTIPTDSVVAAPEDADEEGIFPPHIKISI
jgi:hypothetical protein